MGERDAGFAGLPEQLRRLFPDGTWPEYPYKKRSKALPVDVEVASALLALIPNWAGDWNDFAPFLWARGCNPSDLSHVTAKHISIVAAVEAQENMERRASRGLTLSAGVGTCTSTFTTFRLESKATDSNQVDFRRRDVPAVQDDRTVKTACSLTDMRKSILVAMLANEATNRRETCPKEMIQDSLRDLGHDVGKSFASHSKALRKAGLIDSQTCSPYGYWLTDWGVEVATYLRDDDALLSVWYRRWQEDDEAPQSKVV